jgi:hypothetical protein
MENLKAKALAVLAFCGGAAHRRAIAIVLALLITHFAGKEFEVENIDQILSLVIAAIGAAWSRGTFKEGSA